MTHQPDTPQDGAEADAGGFESSGNGAGGDGGGRWAPEPTPPDDTVVYGTSWIRLAVLTGLTLLLGLWAGWSLLVIIGGLVVMIFLHELGHYVTARMTGMKVTEFFIGFGPRLWSFHWGETEYGFKAIPAGAYVRIIGMNNLDEVAPGDESKAYRAQTFPRRLLVVSAGSLMHMVQAIVIAFVLLVFVGMPGGAIANTDWRIGEVTPGSAADEAGLQPGDRIVAWNGDSVDMFRELSSEVDDAEVGDEVTLTVQRGDEVFDTTAELGDSAFLGVGVDEANDEVITVVEGSGAAEAGIQQDDQIVAWEGDEVQEFDQIRQRLDGALPGDEVTLTVEREEAGETERVDLPVELGSRGPSLGISTDPDYPADEKLNPLEGTVQAVGDTGSVIKQSAESLASFFSPSGLSNFFDTAFGGDGGSGGSEGAASSSSSNSDADNGRVVSIVGAVQIGESLSQESWAQVLFLFFILNVFIGVINMVPLLPLDGGHAAVAIYERLRSRNGVEYRVDAAKLLPMTYAVVMVLLFIGGTAIWLDLVDPISM